MRFTFAAIYDISVFAVGKDRILPDSKLYSSKGWYVAFLINGYNRDTSWKNYLPVDPEAKSLFYNALYDHGGDFPRGRNESNLYFFIIGIIYTIVGYFPLAVRTFNIGLSIGSAYLLFRIARRRINEVTANIFLLIALFLPTQVIYSITLSRDFLRMFLISLILWIIYGGDICPKRRAQ